MLLTHRSSIWQNRNYYKHHYCILCDVSLYMNMIIKVMVIKMIRMTMHNSTH